MNSGNLKFPFLKSTSLRSNMDWQLYEIKSVLRNDVVWIRVYQCVQWTESSILYLLGR